MGRAIHEILILYMLETFHITSWEQTEELVQDHHAPIHNHGTRSSSEFIWLIAGLAPVDPLTHDV